MKSKSASMSRPGPADAHQQKSKPTQAQILIWLAEAKTKVFHSSGHQTFADIRVHGHRETWPIRSKSFRRWLVREFYLARNKPPGGQALHDAIGILEAKALFDSQERNTFIRVAGNDEAIYIDLCNPEWQAIKITAAGWRLMAEPPVRFRRARGMLPLPVPVAGGSLARLRSFVNVGDSDEWILILAWLVAAFRPCGPYPILIIHGGQGSAKSTLMQILRNLIDPNLATLRSDSRDIRDLMIAASNAWCLSFDNLSHLAGWLSDAFCRLSTGGGFATRELYSDADEVIFSAKRPLILNAITELATRGDLLDRAITLRLSAIEDAKRVDEKTFWQKFEQAKPQILGALLDALAMAMRNLPNVRLASLPRMADFAKWAVAAEPALDCVPGAFVKAYAKNRLVANELSLDASPTALLIPDLAEAGEWMGTATDLLNILTERANQNTRKLKAWPNSARAMSNTLRRLTPNLRATGIDVEFYRTGGTKSRRIIRIRRSLQSSVASVADPSNTLGDVEVRRDASCDDRHLFASQRNSGNGQTCDGSDGSDAKTKSYSKTDGRDFADAPF